MLQFQSAHIILCMEDKIKKKRLFYSITSSYKVVIKLGEKETENATL